MYEELRKNASLRAFRERLTELCVQDGTLPSIIKEMQKMCDEADYDLLRQVCIELEIENQVLREEYDEANFDASFADIQDEVTIELVAQVMMNLKKIEPDLYDTIEQRWKKK